MSARGRGLIARVVLRLVRTKLWLRMRRRFQAARILRPWGAFVVGEWRGGARRYAIGGHAVIIRHRSRDVAVVTEIFGPKSPYEPPEALDRQRLAAPLSIVDLGGNIGLFGVFALARWRVLRIVSFEPDPRNSMILRRVRDLNDCADRWTVCEDAIGNADGSMELVSLGSPESRRAQAGESGIPVPRHDLFGLGWDIDLLKIDIEGGEWEILTDPRLAELRAEVIVLEWHWRDAPCADAHQAAVDHLQRAGYRIERDDQDDGDVAHGIGVLWASRVS